MNLAKLLASAGNEQQAYPIYMARNPTRGIYYANQQLGFRAAISRNGNVLAAITTYNNGLSFASIFIYNRTGQSWSESGQDIRLNQNHASASTLASIALSADGSTLAYGYYLYSQTGGVNSGSVSVYVKSGAAYTLQQEIQSSTPTAYANFGFSVSLSDDGNTLVTSHNAGGSTYVYFYTRSAGSWSLGQVVSLGAPSGETTISISSDGTKCVVGNIQESNTSGIPLGVLYFLTKISGTWSVAQRIDGALLDYKNTWADKVVISGDGQTVAVGCKGTSFGTSNGWGRLFVYKLSAGVLSNPVEIPYPLTSEGVSYNEFGKGLALDSAGKTLVVSAQAGNQNQGAAWVFANTGGGWVLQSNLYIYKTATSLAPGYSGHCESLQISGDGSWVCVPDSYATTGVSPNIISGVGDVWLIPR